MQEWLLLCCCEMAKVVVVVFGNGFVGGDK